MPIFPHRLLLSLLASFVLSACAYAPGMYVGQAASDTAVTSDAATQDAPPPPGA